MSAPDIPTFGLKWPPGIPLIQRHQYCAYHNRGLGAFYHRKERIKALWPEFEWHRWNERRLRGLCDYKWLTWLGPGASTKSTDAAVFGLEFWLQAPDRTAVVVCSTTMKLLRMRIFNEFAKYHGRLPSGVGPLGELLDSDTRIRWKKGDNVAGIFGMAVEEGPVEEIINNLIGIHPQRYLLILDEAQGVREAIMRATTNMAKNQWFAALLMGNPDDMNNPLLRESEPVDGWGDTIDRAYAGELDEWETLGGPTKGRGLCQFFDGRKSPADDSTEELARLPWMINKDWVAAHLKGVHGNENDPSFWSQAIGLPPPKGIRTTVLDESIIDTFKCKEKAVWTHGFRQCASLDPAYSAGGDKKVLQFIKFGEAADEAGSKRWVIEFGDWIDVPIDAKIKTPIDHQIVYFCKEQCSARGIKPAMFASDIGGRGAGLKSIFDVEWGVIFGVDFSGQPSERQVHDGDSRTCKEVYDRRATELNMAVREFAQSNGIRGLSDDAAKQFCARLTFYRDKKTRVEAKGGSKVADGKTMQKGFKDRMGYSPDHADACAIGLDLCIEMGAMPSLVGSAATKEGGDEDWNKAAKKAAEEYDEANYLNYADA